MNMYRYVQVVGLINLNNVVNFNFSVGIEVFLHFILTTLSSLNKQIYIFLKFHISGSQLDILSFPLGLTPILRTPILLAQPKCTCEQTGFILALTLAAS